MAFIDPEKIFRSVMNFLALEMQDDDAGRATGYGAAPTGSD
jgi:hypothetical protein